MENGNIIKLEIENYNKCNNIWNMEKQKNLAEKFLKELKCKNRETFVYEYDNEYLGEVSIVFKKDDTDYCIPQKRLYLSRIIVKKEYRNKGIGKKLMNFIIEYAKSLNYKELSLGVNLDNYNALNLYVKLGFDKIIYIGQDEDGQYLKLLKKLD